MPDFDMESTDRSEQLQSLANNLKGHTKQIKQMNDMKDELKKLLAKIPAVDVLSVDSVVKFKQDIESNRPSGQRAYIAREFDDALKILQEGQQMLENLELVGKQIRVLADSGINTDSLQKAFDNRVHMTLLKGQQLYHFQETDKPDIDVMKKHLQALQENMTELKDQTKKLYEASQSNTRLIVSAQQYVDSNKGTLLNFVLKLISPAYRGFFEKLDESVTQYKRDKKEEVAIQNIRQALSEEPFFQPTSFKTLKATFSEKKDTNSDPDVSQRNSFPST